MAADKKRSANAAKVLVFVPPKICFYQPEKKSGCVFVSEFIPEARWDKTYLKFDGQKFVIDDETTTKSGPEVHNSISIDSEVSASGGIVLEYDPELVHESVNSYLDQEFFQTHHETAAFCNSLRYFEGVFTQDRIQSLNKLQREYEAVNFESQLLLKNSISEGPSSHCSSIERRLGDEMADDDTHQLTEDDVYTQFCTHKAPKYDKSTSLSSSEKTNKTQPLFSQSASKSSTKEDERATTNFQQTTTPAELSAASRETAGPLEPSASKTQTNDISKRGRALPNISDKLAYLEHCTKLNDLVNVCVIVLQVNPVREIQIKSGKHKGDYIPLSSVIVADVSKSHFKLTLWRQASRWTDRIIPGDIIIATAIRIESWRNEYIGQTTFNSCFYNLHQPTKPLSHDWLHLVSQERLDELLKQARIDHCYLVRKDDSVMINRPQVKFTRVSEMKNNTLVHFRGVLRKVEVMVNQINDGTYQFENQRLPKIKIVFAESPGEEIIVTLWGRQAEWLKDFRTGEGIVWELQYLTAKHDAPSGMTVLHTTPKSTKTKLTEETPEAKRLLSMFGNIPCEVKAFKSIKHLLGAKFSGSAEISGFISGIIFYSDTNESLAIKSAQDVEILNDSFPYLTYIGCAMCFRPLTQDKNQIYGQCTHCVYHNPDYSYKLGRFYRNFTLKMKDSEGDIEVEVKHSSACKLFKGIEPNQLVKQQQKSCNIDEFLRRVKELVSSKERCRMILSCRTVLDENSFVVSRTFTFMDIR